jgi:hypothetical protein
VDERSLRTRILGEEAVRTDQGCLLRIRPVARRTPVAEARLESGEGGDPDERVGSGGDLGDVQNDVPSASR